MERPQLRIMQEVAWTLYAPAAVIPARVSGAACDHPDDPHASHVQLAIPSGSIWVTVDRRDRVLDMPPGTRVGCVAPLKLTKRGWELGDPHGVSVAPARLAEARKGLEHA